MVDISMDLLAGTIISIALVGTMFAANYRWITPVLAGVIMVIVSYVVAAFTMWGDDAGVVCVGSLLAISLGPVTMGAAAMLRRRAENAQKTGNKE